MTGFKEFMIKENIEQIRSRNEFAVEQIANYILGRNNGKISVPVDIISIARNLGFKVSHYKGEINRKKINKEDSKLTVLDSEYKVIALDKDTDDETARYWVALGLSCYLLESKSNEPFVTHFTLERINNNSGRKAGLIAKALLMPAQEIGIFVNSPMFIGINKDAMSKQVAKTFSVSEELAKSRLLELGYTI